MSSTQQEDSAPRTLQGPSSDLQEEYILGDPGGKTGNDLTSLKIAEEMIPEKAKWKTEKDSDHQNLLADLVKHVKEESLSEHQEEEPFIKKEEASDWDNDLTEKKLNIFSQNLEWKDKKPRKDENSSDQESMHKINLALVKTVKEEPDQIKVDDCQSEVGQADNLSLDENKPSDDVLNLSARDLHLRNRTINLALVKTIKQEPDQIKVDDCSSDDGQADDLSFDENKPSDDVLNLSARDLHLRNRTVESQLQMILEPKCNQVSSQNSPLLLFETSDESPYNGIDNLAAPTSTSIRCRSKARCINKKPSSKAQVTKRGSKTSEKLKVLESQHARMANCSVILSASATFYYSQQRSKSATSEAKVVNTLLPKPQENLAKQLIKNMTIPVQNKSINSLTSGTPSTPSQNKIHQNVTKSTHKHVINNRNVTFTNKTITKEKLRKTLFVPKNSSTEVGLKDKSNRTPKRENKIHKQTHTDSIFCRCLECRKMIDKGFEFKVNSTPAKDFVLKLKGPVPCDICHKSYSTWRNMVVHKHRHHFYKGEFICNDCSKVFPTKRKLKNHIERYHLPPTIKCSKCNSLFHSQTDLQSHMRREHKVDNRDTFVCDQCGKTTKSKSVLETHMLVHSSELGFKCNECGKGFHTMSNLTQHLVTHSDVRPFSCDLCNNSFRIKHHLRQHMSVHGMASTTNYRKRNRRIISSDSVHSAGN